jgi:hypothetical protein
MISPLARLPFSLFTLGLVLAPTNVSAQYRYLCTSIPSACSYTGPDAPSLGADVCFGTATGIRLKGTAPCPTGSWPYYVDAGEVIDPTTNQVAAYIPLDDACSQPGLCVDGPPPGGAQEFPMCCKDGACYDDVLCGGTLWWCVDGVCNADGTITCFEKTPG